MFFKDSYPPEFRSVSTRKLVDLSAEKKGEISNIYLAYALLETIILHTFLFDSNICLIVSAIEQVGGGGSWS